MRLLQFQVQGYKNFRARVLLPDLGRFNVIHGDNNVGKSNLLESIGLFFVAIHALREEAQGGAGIAERYARGVPASELASGDRPPRPSIVMSLELVGLYDPHLPEGRTRQVLALVDSHLGDAEIANLYESRLWLTAPQVLHVAPIKRGGELPFWSALTVMHLQAHLVSHGVRLRGAITFGDATVHGDMAFGPAISAAERLCKEVADVPRVIVDARLLREVEADPNLRAKQHTVLDELGYLRELLRQDSDGFWFVDYLWAFRSEVDAPPLYIEFLKDHRRLVARGLDDATARGQNPRVWTWLWNYHNSVLDKLEREWKLDNQEKADLRIPAASPLLYKFPPSAKAPG